MQRYFWTEQVRNETKLRVLILQERAAHGPQAWSEAKISPEPGRDPERVWRGDRSARVKGTSQMPPSSLAQGPINPSCHHQPGQGLPLPSWFWNFWVNNPASHMLLILNRSLQQKSEAYLQGSEQNLKWQCFHLPVRTLGYGPRCSVPLKSIGPSSPTHPIR